MKQLFATLFLLAFCILPCLAQDKSKASPKDWIDQWKTATQQLIGAAEAMPAEKYDYRPNNDVETFGGQLKHAVAAMKILLANAEGRKVELKDVNLDQVKTKDQIVAAVRKVADEGAAVINKIAGKNDGEPVESQFFGQTTRRFLLIQAIAHNHNHYGQLVFYLRSSGIVPPASRR